MAARSRRHLLNLLAFLVGVVFLAGVVWGLGPEQLAERIAGAGPGWLLLVGTGLAVLAGDSLALKVAVGHPAFTWPRAAATALSGAAVNALTPIGEAGEAIKVNLVSGWVPGEQAVSAVLVWNLLYRLTNWGLVFVSPFLVLAAGSVAFTPVALAGLTAAALLVFTPTLLLLLAVRKGAATLATRILSTLPVLRRRDWGKLAEAAARTDRLVSQAWSLRRRDTALAAALLLSARLAGCLEVWLAMRLVGWSVSFPDAVFLSAGNTLVRVLVSASPVQVGVVEAGAGGLYHLLGLPAEVGVAQGILRRARMLLFNLAGLLYLALSAAGRGRGKPETAKVARRLQST
jgi:uncharacterized protein (TIRG00374 family)